MINRALVIAIIIISLAMAGVIGYALATHYRLPSVPAEMPNNADGEQQQPPKAPEVFEKDVEEVMPAWMLDISGDKAKIVDLLEPQTFRFQLAAGNRAEGEVTLSSESPPWISARILDPYKNALFETKGKFPWRFGFVAAVAGEYSLQVYATGGSIVFNSPSAHLKITVYEK